MIHIDAFKGMLALYNIKEPEENEIIAFLTFMEEYCGYEIGPGSFTLRVLDFYGYWKEGKEFSLKDKK